MNKLFLGLVLLSGFAGFSQHSAFEYAAFVHGPDTLQYRILYPEDFNESEKYPLLLFLHGKGERGSDNEAQLRIGGKFFADSISSYPAIVVFPQCKKEDYWAVRTFVYTHSDRIFTFPWSNTPNPSLGLVSKLVDSLIALPYTNANRIYIGGLSMGGMGTFELVSRKPDTFAAAVAISGGGNEEAASVYANKTPFWIFHGAKDDVVPPAHSENMTRAIRNAGGNPKLTIYPDANHNSWDSAFEEPELLHWIFSHNK